MDYIPVLTENLLIEPIEKDDHYFLHQTDTDFRLKINLHTKHLLSLIDGQKNISLLTDLFNATFNKKISPAEVHLLIKNKFEPYGIVKTEGLVNKKDRADYLKPRFTLLSSSTVSTYSGILQFLIIHKIGYLIGSLSLCLIAFYSLTITSDKALEFITPTYLLWYFPITIMSLIFHELGHASAARKFKITPGGIGVGFYILSPVFYADVSNAWKLAPEKRIIINIAGMYFQLLLSCLMVIIYLLADHEFLLYASLFNALGCLSNLNPFVRYDGYWIVSDLFKFNNLADKAAEKFAECKAWFKNRKTQARPIRSFRDGFLFTYFFVNRAMVGIFLFSIVFLQSNSVITFPEKLVSFIQKTLVHTEVLSFELIRDFWFDNFLSSLFYVLLLGEVKKYLRKLISRRKGQRPHRGAD